MSDMENKTNSKKTPFIGTVTPLRKSGEYPIQQIIFVNMDSVLAPIFNSIIKQKYGEMDIIHQMSQVYKSEINKYSDLEKLLMTSKGVISTCWSIERTLAVLPSYLEAREWGDTKESVRVYSLGWLVNDPKENRP